MLEQTCVPLRAGRLQCERLVAPVKKTSNRIIYLTEKPSSNAFPKYGKATDTSKTDPLNTSVGYEINSVIAELEERRAKLLAFVRAAETRAREAEEEYEQFKSRQIQETNQRLVTEQKLREIKEDSLRLLGAEAGAHEDAESHLMPGSPVIRSRRDEQKTRHKAEKGRAVIELKKWKKEGEIGSSEERRRQQENGPNNFILYATAITLLVGACLLLIAAFL
jgi:hypothetical protein